MQQINLGLEWDVASDLDKALQNEQERLANAPQSKDGKKVTPAQKRDALFAIVAQAIEEGNPDKVDEVLVQNPKLLFNVGEYGAVYTALMENFNAEVAQKLTARKLYLTTYGIYHYLVGQHNATLLEHFIARCTEEKALHFFESLYSHTLKGFTSNIPDQRRKEWREQRQMLERVDPDIWQNVLHTSAMHKVFTSYTSLPQAELNELKSLPAESWQTVFDHWFISFNRQPYIEPTKIDFQTFKNVLNFLSAVPPAQAGWDLSVKSLSVQNQEHNNFIRQYFSPQEEFKDSKLAEILSAFHMGQPKTTFPFKSKKGEKLGLTSFEYAQLASGFWEQSTLSAVNGVQPPFEKIPQYTPPSFIHLLVQTASPASWALLESENGKNLYAQCLQEPTVFKGWCEEASQELITAVVRACPQLLEWTDPHNNCLGHYLVVLRQESSQAFGQLLARLNHNWLLHENDQGVSVKDLFQAFGATQTMLNGLDKDAIKRSLKDAGIKKTRRTAPAAKRRM